LLAAQVRGFLGPGPIAGHVDRALELVGGLVPPPARALDLGSGAGLPGLPLALAWPETEWVLLDGSRTRAGVLEQAVSELGLTDRVAVVGQRAEIAGRGPYRGGFDLVVARSFAPPAPTAECGSPFVRAGGILVVAEPPGGTPGRWDPAGLAQLGMRLGAPISGHTAYQQLVQDQPCPERFPRRVGIPAKRPLF
jgi:16S rRNA (guanine527-N7)-methyltransferase